MKIQPNLPFESNLLDFISFFFCCCPSPLQLHPKIRTKRVNEMGENLYVFFLWSLCCYGGVYLSFCARINNFIFIFESIKKIVDLSGRSPETSLIRWKKKHANSWQFLLILLFFFFLFEKRCAFRMYFSCEYFAWVCFAWIYPFFLLFDSLVNMYSS